MSMESAMAALAEPSNTAANAPTIDSQGVPLTPTTPKTLEEAVKPVKQAAEPTKPPGADRFAALAKKERQLQKQMAELKAQQAQVSKMEQARQEAMQNPIKALEMLGLSYEQITQFMLNGQKPTPELELQSVKQEIQKLREEQEAKAKAVKEEQENQAKAEYQRTLSEFSQEVSDFVKGNSETYELTALYQGESIIQATIEQHYKNQSNLPEYQRKVMPIKEAAELVEKYFEDQVIAAQKAKKFQAKQTPKEVSQPKRESVSKQPTPTISNELTSSAPSLLPAKTENDRMQRALAALNQG